VTVNGTAGDAANASWLSVRVASGGLTVNGSASFHGSVTADRLTVNGTQSAGGPVTSSSSTLWNYHICRYRPGFA
jgi:hypothetical protein